MESYSPSVSGVRVAVLTPAGRGALAVIGVAGPGADTIVDRCFQSRSGRSVAGRDAGTVAFGRWRSVPGGTAEELVVVRYSPERVEVHCHGGVAASAAVVASLVDRGAVAVAWPEWLRAVGRTEIEVEAHEALCMAAGSKAARILCRQLAGALVAECERLERLWTTGDEPALAAALDRLERAARVGLRLTRPWRVVCTGVVNAGKSSLVNALAGHARSIVSSTPGTTRDALETRLVLDGWEVELVDTAGLREPGVVVGSTERAGIARAVAARADADLVLRVVPAAAARDAAAPSAPGELVVLSKCDAGPPDEIPAGVVATSASTGMGIERLAAEIVAALVPEERLEPDLLAGAVPFTARQVESLSRFRRPPSPCPGPARAAGSAPR